MRNLVDRNPDLSDVSSLPNVWCDAKWKVSAYPLAVGVDVPSD